MAGADGTPAMIVERLRDAANAHDVEAIVACFAADYRNETPVHPARGFVGRDQVRRNWSQILTAIPDLRTEIIALVATADTVWSEWEQRGTREDGSLHLMRGVIIASLRGGLIGSARFYLEPVDLTSDAVDSAVRRQVRPGPS